MQNLPISATPPAAAAPLPASADNGAAQATEPFGSVLARQIADAPTASGLPADSAKLIELQESAPDEASTLPADMLAALLPAPANMRGAVDPLRQQQVASGMRSGTRQAAAPAALRLARGDIPSSTPADGNTASAAPSAGTRRTAQIPAQANVAAVLDASGGVTASTAPSAGTQRIAQIPAQADVAALPTLTQTGTTPIAASPNTPVQTAVNTPLSHGGWGEEFNQKITWLATQHGQSAALHLNPPQLGPLDVVLKVNGDQATALFISPHAAVREAVEQALPRLREMLAENGIMLGNTTVSDQAPKEQQAGLADKRQNGSGSWPKEENDAVLAGGIQVAAARRHLGMVDTFA